MTDLASLLHQAIEQHRDHLNSSRIAHGEHGKVEIHVSTTDRDRHRIKLIVLVPVDYPSKTE